MRRSPVGNWPARSAGAVPRSGAFAEVNREFLERTGGHRHSPSGLSITNYPLQARARRSTTATQWRLQGAASLLEPREVLARELRRENFENSRVVVVPPIDFGFGQHVAIDQRLVDRHQRQRLEAEPFAFHGGNLAPFDQ